MAEERQQDARNHQRMDALESQINALTFQLGNLATALESRNEIDRCFYKKMDERDKRMEKMMVGQQKAYHKLIWGMILSILVLAGVNVAQLTGFI